MQLSLNQQLSAAGRGLAEGSKPNLNLQFAVAKTLDSRITFTRASSATYYDSTGRLQSASTDTARLDHDPSTLESKGLLIEESRTNLLTYSEDFTQWSPVNAPTISSNSDTALDGTVTADTLTDNNASGLSLVSSNSNSATDTTVYTFSIYVKKDSTGRATRFPIFRILWTGATATADLKLDTATGETSTATSGGAVVDSTNVIDSGDYYRVVLSAHATNVATSGVRSDIYPAAGADSGWSAGASATGSIIIWGAQLEAGSFPTSYIPTDSAQATRQADTAVMTGVNFSDWYNNSTSTIVANWLQNDVSGTSPVLNIDDGTANDIIAFYGSTTNPTVAITDGGVAQATIDAGTIASGTFYKMASSIVANDINVSLDGGAVINDASATIPSVTQLRIGTDGTNYLNGTLKSISYYATALTDNEIIGATS